MSEQYRCSECGHFVEIQDEAICDVCNIGIMQHLRYTKGGDGSHWEGCEDVHWDCKIAQLEAELARRNEERNALADENRMLSERIQRLVDGAKSRDEIIARLKEDAERLYVLLSHIVTKDKTYEAVYEYHRALMKELEE